jgi:type VI secretion system protein VasJ
LQRYGMQLHPQRDRSRKAALEWLAGSRVLDSLSLFPEVVREDAQRTAGALLLISTRLETEPEASRPELNALYSAGVSPDEGRGVDAVVPQNAGNKAQSQPFTHATESDAGSEPHHVRSGFAGPGPY